MADIAKLETFNAAFGKMAQAKKLLDDALVQLDIFVHANQTNPDAQEFFERLTKSVPPAKHWRADNYEKNNPRPA